MEGHDTLSRSILRIAKAAAAIALASAPFVAFGLPALAGSNEPSPRYEWWLRTLHVVQAWQSGDGNGVTTAVLSDGVATNQRYLAGSVIIGPDFTKSSRAPGNRYYGVLGTSLASLIIGHGKAGSRPVDGVAPGAKILSIRVTLSPGDPLWANSKITSRLPDAIAAGIKYAVSHGATVIDLPADPGVRYPSIAAGSAAAAGGSPAERAAVQYAISRNVLLVAPAGDNARSGNDVNYPAAYSGVIAVGAFGPNFLKAPFSSRQPYVALTAAGQNVVAATQSGFRTLNSTSAASAIVAGIATLIRSEFPNLTVAQVRSSMVFSTVNGRKQATSNGSGFGTVDAIRAVAAAATMSPPHARLAMDGAVRRSRPVAPMVRSSASIIARDLTGDAGLSMAALAMLLIPIITYGTMAKRRERREVLLAAERSQHGLNRPGHGTMLADPLLEFFGPQHARPAGPPSARPIVVPRFQPRPGLTGRSTMSASLVTRSPMPSAPTRNQDQTAPRRAPAALPAPTAQAPSGALPNRRAPEVVGPDSTVRRVQVSGSPPWEPAREPASELPWVVAPQPQQGVAKVVGGDVPAIPPPPDSVWDSAPARRSSAPRSLFEPAPPPPALAPPQPVVNPGQLSVSQTSATQTSATQYGVSQPVASQYLPSQPSASEYGASEYGASEYGASEYEASQYEASPHPGSSESGQPTSWQDLAGFDDRSGGDSDRGPIFAWNPSASTDQFAAIDPARTDRPGRPDNDRRRS